MMVISQVIAIKLNEVVLVWLTNRRQENGIASEVARTILPGLDFNSANETNPSTRSGNWAKPVEKFNSMIVRIPANGINKNEMKNRLGIKVYRIKEEIKHDKDKINRPERSCWFSDIVISLDPRSYRENNTLWKCLSQIQVSYSFPRIHRCVDA